MRVNASKTKVMGVNCEVELELEGKKFEQVTEFRYLGLVVCSKSTNPSAMLAARILAAKKAFYSL